MSKQRYEAPAVRRVRLVVKNAILSTCHSSPNLTPRDVAIPGAGCAVNTGCYNP